MCTVASPQPPKESEEIFPAAVAALLSIFPLMVELVHVRLAKPASSRSELEAVASISPVYSVPAGLVRVGDETLAKSRSRGW
ncbi:MAG TPA: hypothetical protein VD761_02180, partial [Solirubrobacterales bacterium]|nr:hypothetical protein [Solirubrobacterales bacterium]